MTPDINYILRKDMRNMTRGAPMGDSDRYDGSIYLYRAPMGDSDRYDGSIYLYLQRVRFVDSAYGPDGTYWGMGTPLWCAFNADNAEHKAGHGTRIYVRAHTREQALTRVLAEYVNTRFYR